MWLDERAHGGSRWLRRRPFRAVSIGRRLVVIVDRVENGISRTAVALTGRRPVAEMAARPVGRDGAEARLRAIVEAQPACLLEVAPDGRLLAMNAANLALVGGTRLAQVLGKDYGRLVAPADRERVGRFIRRVCEGHCESLEYSVLLIDGTARAVASDAVPLERDAGETVVALMVTRDMTETRELEQALRATGERNEQGMARHADERQRLEQAEDRIRQLVTQQEAQSKRVGRALSRAHAELQDLRGTARPMTRAVVLTKN
jgi:PAS domain S-box-containing protein